MSPISRRRFGALVSLCALGLAAGCAQSEKTAGTPAPDSGAAPAAGPLKVGLITPGKITDGGWCQSANDGLERIKTELQAEIVPAVEQPAPAEVAGAIRNLAQGGATLVFLHGSEYDDPAATVAKDFPKTTFVVVGGRTTAPNLAPIQFAAGEGTYLAGMLAAGMSKSHKIACVGGTKIPIIEAAFASFEKGAKAVDPNCDVKIVFTGSFDDQAKAKQQTQALLDAGVDVVTHNANEAGKGVAQAVQGKDGVLFLGANADQSDLVTDRNLGSFVIDSPNAYVAVAKAVRDGKTDGKPFSLGLKDKAVTFQFNARFKGTVPEDLKKKLEQAEKNIVDGKITP